CRQGNGLTPVPAALRRDRGRGRRGGPRQQLLGQHRRDECADPGAQRRGDAADRGVHLPAGHFEAGPPRGVPRAGTACPDARSHHRAVLVPRGAHGRREHERVVGNAHAVVGLVLVGGGGG
ncbi:unnamed protein product, partial [Prorocentrum cordatum]